MTGLSKIGLGFHGVRAVFDEPKSVPSRQIDHRVHVARPPGEMDDEQGAGARRDPALDIGCIDVHRVRIDVGQHRRGSGVDDGVDGAAERQSRRDHLIPCAHTRGDETEMDGGGTGIHGGGLIGVLVGGELTLELGDAWAGPEPSGAKRRDNFVDLGVLDRRPAEHDEGAGGIVAHGAACAGASPSQA